MVDANILAASFLRITDANNKLNPPTFLPVRGTTGSIYTVDLPEEFDPVLGPAVVVASRGGISNPDLSQIIRRRMQVDVWGAPDQYKVVGATYAALYDWAHSKDNVTINNVGTLMAFNELVPPQDLSDQDTGWVHLVAFYELIARS
jgi:hypothetical protein